MLQPVVLIYEQMKNRIRVAEFSSSIIFYCKALNIIPRFAKTRNSKLQIFFYNIAFFGKLKLLKSDDAFV
ncbi:hypothetical protein T02_15736 [Trichinella nativa]|uniref:Uncharacterized protein n=1 Tax=Trichinella nativa TaxID=6335 RepID=A0A0V1KT31_9BILA|nr:hypothetical protein T02_15736 [Trichinella nativa]